jgi:hypothetical protein
MKNSPSRVKKNRRSSLGDALFGDRQAETHPQGCSLGAEQEGGPGVAMAAVEGVVAPVGDDAFQVAEEGGPVGKQALAQFALGVGLFGQVVHRGDADGAGDGDVGVAVVADMDVMFGATAKASWTCRKSWPERLLRRMSQELMPSAAMSSRPWCCRSA